MNNIEELINELNLEIETCEISAYLICKECMKEVKNGVAGDVTPEGYGRLAVGFGGIGLQVWCLRHQRSVADLQLRNDDHGELPY